MDGVLGAAATGPGGLGARFFLLPADEFRLLSIPTGNKYVLSLTHICYYFPLRSSMTR